MSAVAALVLKETRVMRRDQRFLLWLFLFPIAMILLLKGALGNLTAGHGADQAVPGFTVMFSFDIITYVAVSHYREHAWKVWTVVRSTGIREADLVVGILAPYFVLGVAQTVVMLLFGVAAFGASLNGSAAGLLLLAMATQVVVAGLAVVLLNLTSSLTTMKQLTQMIVFVLGAVGGALVPVKAMGSWAVPLARFTPQFWSIEGFKTVMSRHGGLGDVLPNIAVLLGAGVVLLLLGASRYDPAKSRRSPAR